MLLRVPTLAAVVSLAALGTAPAAAQDVPPQYIDSSVQVDVGDIEPDAQGTRFVSRVTCTAPPPGLSVCPVKLQVTAKRTKTGKWAPTGAAIVLDVRDVNIPTGAGVDVDVRVPPSKFRDPMTKSHSASIVTFLFTHAGSESGQESVYVGPRSIGTCGGPQYTRLLAGSLEEEFKNSLNSPRRWDPLTSPDLAHTTTYRVAQGPAKFRVNGVTYTVAQGTIFRLICSGVGSVARGRLFTSVFLFDGSVRAVGRPRGKSQPAVDVTTYEGGLGTRSQEAVDMTVSRDDDRDRSVLQMHKGRTGQITPFKTKKSSPCTNGSRLAVDSVGRITKL